MHQNAEGGVLFQIVEKRNAVTFRKKSSTAAPAAVEPALSSATEST
jgi:hypothetical protein